MKHNNLGPSLLNGKSTSIVGGLDILTPPKVEEDTAWSFPHDSDDGEEWTSAKVVLRYYTFNPFPLTDTFDRHLQQFTIENIVAKG